MLVANDGMAGGVIAALTSRNLNGKVMVTGQDATDAGLQRILAGDQSMTVYKALKAEARTSAEIALLLAAGKLDEVKAGGQCQRRQWRRRRAFDPARSGCRRHQQHQGNGVGRRIQHA